MVAQPVITGTLNVRAFDALKGLSGRARTLPIIDRTAMVDAARSVLAITNLQSVVYLPLASDTIEPSGPWQAISLAEAKREAWEYCWGQPDDMPNLPTVPLNAAVVAELSPADCAMLAHAAHAARTVGTDGSRPAIQYVLLKPARDSLAAVGCDGFRLTECLIGTSIAERAYLIPANVATALGKLKCYVELSVGSRETWTDIPILTFDCLATSRGPRVAVIITRDLHDQGAYPDYEVVIPRPGQYPDAGSVSYTAGEWLAYARNAVARRKANDRLPNPRPDDDPALHCILEAERPNGGLVTAVVNPAYLEDAMAGLPSNLLVTLHLTGVGGGPALFTVENVRLVIMPMALRDHPTSH